MPPKYQLYYYDARARGELARIVLAQADVEYEDVRIPFNEWSKYKKGNFTFRRGVYIQVESIFVKLFG